MTVVRVLAAEPVQNMIVWSELFAKRVENIFYAYWQDRIAKFFFLEFFNQINFKINYIGWYLWCILS